MNKRVRKILFCGNGVLGERILEIIAQEQSFAITVFVRLTKQNKSNKATILICKRLNLPFLVAKSISAATDAISIFSPEIVFVCSYGELIKLPFLQQFRCVNLHPSLLPKYRGATPVLAALRNNEKRIGISLVKMVSKMDCGNLFFQQSISLLSIRYNLQETYNLIGDFCQQHLVTWLTAIMDKRVCATIRQDNSVSSYCWKLKRDFNKIDDQQTAPFIVKFINILSPIYHPYINCCGQRLIIHKAIIATNKPQNNNSTQLGQIIEFNQSGLTIKCRSSAYKITRMQLPGRKPLSARDFFNGYSHIFHRSND